MALCYVIDKNDIENWTMIDDLVSFTAKPGSVQLIDIPESDCKFEHQFELKLDFSHLTDEEIERFKKDFQGIDNEPLKLLEDEQ